MTMLRIACAQYPIHAFADPAQWAGKVSAWVEEAAQAGARLLLFPEYGAMELASLLSPNLQNDLGGQIAALQELLPAFLARYAGLAQRHGVSIVAPSIPVLQPGGYVNRAHVFAPDGGMAWQDKRQMTRFEREEWIIQGGAELRLFDTGLGCRFGLAICYDVEFPLIARALAEAGADLVLAPSCTDTLAGMHRVHVGARARALESQIYVAVAQTVGEAQWSPAVDVNHGFAAIYATPDRGFPDDGILAQGALNQPGWVYADLNCALLSQARSNAQVFTRRDWAGQHLPSLDVGLADFAPPPKTLRDGC
ncbi:carbon-nitrogen hydrolase family protein [Ferrovibrio sp.]|uniref:carbon-nitrogen hydrolase family protein n=1 Tax=Ferrovibrio sp. TaxID=1917215 RepID=UPI001B45B79C|nr:carbon-nitrogen hydrolase family protein [Ferrovibrio sp.]MBP7062679.1 carbon-nitrogen hydrolase family protein [Ferrovibrio sp.]